ncbi:YdbL family protein [Microbulbifer sp. OS29]|uniref:YdbL family protein n=1 Tax=Microbulbifer okhotskensis TaxID=2926617 RepID=A0A9X2EMU7_9GAMM|nr:YdbL family protein [Microbulbifer okhotskensis]MCO1334584.1 YdbL family protein [Microbulbifer okhotskensis]
MKRMIKALWMLGLTIALPVMAMSLDEAKSKGLLGEANSGYVAIVDSSSPELEKLIKEVNSKRKAAYARIAERNNIDIAQVATRAAEKLEARLGPGEYYQDNLGRWKRK